MTYIFNPQRALVHTHAEIKINGQLVQKVEWKWTDTTDFITFFAIAVGNKISISINMSKPNITKLSLKLMIILGL